MDEMKRSPGRPRITEKRFCTLEWCSRPLYAVGLCDSHYNAKLRGTPLKPPGNKKAASPCAFELCDRQAEVLDWCKAHYMQHWKGKELAPIRESRKDATRPGERNCKECGEWKPVEDFHKGSRPGQRQSRCRPCYNERMRLQRAAKKAESVE